MVDVAILAIIILPNDILNCCDFYHYLSFVMLSSKYSSQDKNAISYIYINLYCASHSITNQAKSASNIADSLKAPL